MSQSCTFRQSSNADADADALFEAYLSDSTPQLESIGHVSSTCSSPLSSSLNVSIPSISSTSSTGSVPSLSSSISSTSLPPVRRGRPPKRKVLSDEDNSSDTSSVHIDKKARRRAQNRTAAASCRLKKKAHLVNLQKQVAELSASTSLLQAQLKRLQEENENLLQRQAILLEQRSTIIQQQSTPQPSAIVEVPSSVAPLVDSSAPTVTPLITTSSPTSMSSSVSSTSSSSLLSPTCSVARPAVSQERTRRIRLPTITLRLTPKLVYQCVIMVLAACMIQWNNMNNGFNGQHLSIPTVLPTVPIIPTRFLPTVPRALQQMKHRLISSPPLRSPISRRTITSMDSHRWRMMRPTPLTHSNGIIPRALNSQTLYRSTFHGGNSNFNSNLNSNFPMPVSMSDISTLPELGGESFVQTSATSMPLNQQHSISMSDVESLQLLLNGQLTAPHICILVVLSMMRTISTTHGLPMVVVAQR